MRKMLLLLLAACFALTACDIYDMPLPGGTAVGDDPIVVTIEFADVLDLVPMSSVKVNDISVGNVTDVSLDGETAEVTVELAEGTDLPANARASIRQTSLLGEKFVSLEAPEDPSAERLVSGDRITLANSGRNPEVEEVLGALSLILNGGGVGQLQTISRELNNALGGRESSARSVLSGVDELVGNLDDNKSEIVNAIESLDRLSVRVNKQIGVIDQTLEEVPSALDSIDSQREDLVTMLRALDDLGTVGTRVIRASKESTVATVRELQPILTKLADSGDDLAGNIDLFATFPFVDEAVGRNPQTARSLHMGDYVNLDINLQVDLSYLLDNVTGPGGPQVTEIIPTVVDPTQTVSDVVACILSGDLTSKACKAVLAVPSKLLNLKKACRKPKFRNTTLCKLLNQLPDTVLPSGLLPSDLPSSGDLESVVCGLLGCRPTTGSAAGLNRAGTGATLHKPSVAELGAVFDPDLVALLVPAIATPQGETR